MREFSRIFIEECCIEHNLAKSRKFQKLVEKYHTILEQKRQKKTPTQIS